MRVVEKLAQALSKEEKASNRRKYLASLGAGAGLGTYGGHALGKQVQRGMMVRKGAKVLSGAAGSIGRTKLLGHLARMGIGGLGALGGTVAGIAAYHKFLRKKPDKKETE